ncbi:MAG: hypothetical protein WDK96_02830 [Candidatus Paceibacterota bacterium]|jgi:hypothetical protein
MAITIKIPDKTFDLYEKGLRTFIHIEKERETELSGIKFGDEMEIISETTGKKLEQIFWFMYSFVKIKRFIFIVFKWSVDDPLFRKRKLEAIKEWRSRATENIREISVVSNYQQQLFFQLEAFSSFMFIAHNELHNGIVNFRFLGKNSEKRSSKSYIIINRLGIKDDPLMDNESCWYVYSVFPISLLY